MLFYKQIKSRHCSKIASFCVDKDTTSEGRVLRPLETFLYTQMFRKIMHLSSLRRICLCRFEDFHHWMVCRRMYDPDTGLFEQGNIQDWQHAGMYAAFMISGIVDLVGFYSSPGTLPHGTEHVILPPLLSSSFLPCHPQKLDWRMQQDVLMIT